MGLRLSFGACLVGLCLLGPCVATGCVERRLLLRSDPSGARVYVDGRPLGETPVEMPFRHYGTREVLFYRAGYHSLHLRARMRPPIWSLFPLDLFAAIGTPWRPRDEHALTVRLDPLVPPTLEEILERASPFASEVRDR